MIDIAALRVMVAAGMSASAIVDVIEADRKADAEAAADKREAARQRQINHRATKKLNETNDSVTNVTMTARDTCDSDSALSSLLPSPPTSTDSLLNKKEEVLESGRARSKLDAKSSKGIRLPDDWAPKDKHVAEAAKLGRDTVWMSGLADDMRLWAHANSNRPVARKADWDLTFSGWMRREAAKPRAGPTIGNGAAPRPGSREDRQERLANVLQSIDPRTRSHPDDARRSEGPAAPIAGLLPFGRRN